MLELAILLLLVALCLGALSVVGFAAALAAGVGVILVVIFVDWLRHRTAPARGWVRSRFGERLRPVFDARADDPAPAVAVRLPRLARLSLVHAALGLSRLASAARAVRAAIRTAASPP